MVSSPRSSPQCSNGLLLFRTKAACSKRRAHELKEEHGPGAIYGEVADLVDDHVK